MSTDSVISRDVSVGLENGLHLAPASEIVRLVKQFGCELQLRKGDRTADGTSMIDLLTLAVERGQVLSLEARGDRAAELLDTLIELLAGQAGNSSGAASS